jgi:hypothetical protein
MEGPKRASTSSSKKSLAIFKCFGVGLLLQRSTYLLEISFLKGRVFLSKIIFGGVPYKGSTHVDMISYNFTCLFEYVAPKLAIVSTLNDMIFAVMIEEVLTSLE